jgi:hypothetical protein
MKSGEYRRIGFFSSGISGKGLEKTLNTLKNVNLVAKSSEGIFAAVRENQDGRKEFFIELL